jgi:hypothetical protein
VVGVEIGDGTGAADGDRCALVKASKNTCQRGERRPRMTVAAQTDTAWIDAGAAAFAIRSFA